MGLWRRGAGVFPDFHLHLSEIVDGSGYLSPDLEAKIEGNLPEKWILQAAAMHLLINQRGTKLGRIICAFDSEW